MICDNCAWNYCGETYEFCIDRRKASCGFMESCPRFCQPSEEFIKTFGVKKNNGSICSVCKRDKDPGKCWWCGN